MARPAEPAETEPFTNQSRILLVEGQLSTRLSLTRLLSEHYQVDAAADPTAVTLARDRPPDLVIANVTTRALRDFDISCELHREGWRRVPLILYSAAYDEGSCVNVLEAGSNGYQSTPFSERQFLVLVRSQLESAQMRHESMSSGEEEALRVSEERHRTFMAMTALAVWTAAPNGEVVSDVYGWTELTGQTPEQYRGSGWLETLHPNDKPRILESWRHALRDGMPFAADYRVRRKDGTYGYVRDQGVPLRNSDGSVREWIGMVIDIDDQKRVEEALRSSEKELRANFELAGIGQVQTDPKTGRYIRVNNRFCEMVGYSAAELLTMTYLDITHPDDRAAARPLFSICFAAKPTSSRPRAGVCARMARSFGDWSPQLSFTMLTAGLYGPSR